MDSRRGFVALVGLVALLFVAAVAARPWAAFAQPVTGAPNCPLFPASSPWNQRVDALPVASGSAALVRATGITHLHPDFSDSDADGYGIPFNVVGSDAARVDVAFDYADESDPAPYAMPAPPQIEGGSDRHLLVLDRDRCVLEEWFAAERVGGGWHAGSGARWDLRSLALRPAGWTSADAAGLPILPGLARFSELGATGGIDHALRITLPATQRAYLWPARHLASDQTAPQLAPMGMRLRVRASFDTRAFGPQARAILEAGKRYGFIVADNGSAGYISGAPDAGWDDDDLHLLHDVPASALEVVDTTGLPGTPARARAWNLRWSRVGTRTLRASTFVSRRTVVTATATRGGIVRARRRVATRQGLVRIDLPRITGARYALRIG
jgi:hypothetical protein